MISYIIIDNDKNEHYVQDIKELIKEKDISTGETLGYTIQKSSEYYSINKEVYELLKTQKHLTKVKTSLNLKDINGNIHSISIIDNVFKDLNLVSNEVLRYRAVDRTFRNILISESYYNALTDDDKKNGSESFLSKSFKKYLPQKKEEKQ